MRKQIKGTVSLESMIKRFLISLRAEHPELSRAIKRLVRTLREAGAEVDELVIWERTLDLLGDDKRMSALKASYDKLMTAETEMAKLVLRSRKIKG